MNKKMTNFYEALKANNTFYQKLLNKRNELGKKQLSLKETKDFIENEIIPIANKLGYNISLDDFISNKKEKLSDEDLFEVSGGTSNIIKSLGLASIIAVSGVSGFGISKIVNSNEIDNIESAQKYVVDDEASGQNRKDNDLDNNDFLEELKEQQKENNNNDLNDKKNIEKVKEQKLEREYNTPNNNVNFEKEEKNDKHIDSSEEKILKEENDRLNKENEQLKKENLKLKEENGRLKKENIEIQKTLNKMQKQVESLTLDIEKKNKELKNALNRISEISIVDIGEKEKLKSEVQKIDNLLLEEKEIINKKDTEVKSETDGKYEKIIRDLEDENNKLKEEIKSLNNVNLDLKNKSEVSDTTTSKLEEKSQDYNIKSENDKLKEENLNLNKEVAKLKDKIADLEKKIGDLITQNKPVLSNDSIVSEEENELSPSVSSEEEEPPPAPSFDSEEDDEPPPAPSFDSEDPIPLAPAQNMVQQTNKFWKDSEKRTAMQILQENNININEIDNTRLSIKEIDGKLAICYDNLPIATPNNGQLIRQNEIEDIREKDQNLQKKVQLREETKEIHSENLIIKLRELYDCVGEKYDLEELKKVDQYDSLIEILSNLRKKMNLEDSEGLRKFHSIAKDIVKILKNVDKNSNELQNVKDEISDLGLKIKINDFQQSLKKALNNKSEQQKRQLTKKEEVKQEDLISYTQNLTIHSVNNEVKKNGESTYLTQKIEEQFTKILSLTTEGVGEFFKKTNDEQRKILSQKKSKPFIAAFESFNIIKDNLLNTNVGTKTLITERYELIKSLI